MSVEVLEGITARRIMTRSAFERPQVIEAPRQYRVGFNLRF